MSSRVEHVHWHLHRVHIGHGDGVGESGDQARGRTLAGSWGGEQNGHTRSRHSGGGDAIWRRHDTWPLTNRFTMCSYIGQRPPEKPNTWDRMHEVPSPSERAAPRELSLTRGLGALDGRQLQANLEGAVYSWNSNPNWQLDGPRPVHGELDLHWYRVGYPSLRSRDPPPRPSLRWKLQGDLRNGDLDRQWNDGRHKSLLLYDSMLLRPNGPRIGRHPRARVVAPPTAPPSNGELY